LKEELQKPTAFDIEFERLIGSKKKAIIERSTVKSSDRSTAGASSNENSIENIGEATTLA